MTSEVKIIMLGTGTPNALPSKSGPAIALSVDEQVYLLDCGPGLVRRAEAAVLQGVSELVVKNLSRVFLTHLHSDHTAGLADLLLTPWVLGRDKPLQVLVLKALLRCAIIWNKHIRSIFKIVFMERNRPIFKEFRCKQKNIKKG